MKTNAYFLILFFFLFGATACKKNDPENIQQTALAEPVVEEGRLKFNSFDAFKTYVNRQKGHGTRERLPALKLIGFTSHLANYTTERLKVDTAPQAKMAVEDSLRDSPIQDDFFASLLDANKELEIGEDIIYRAGNDYCFVYNKGDYNLIDQFYQSVRSGNVSLEAGQTLTYSDKLLVYRTESDTEVLPQNTGQGSPNGRIVSLFGRKVSNSSPFDCCTRLFGQAWATNYLIYSSSGIETNIEKRHWLWGWSAWGNPSNCSVGMIASITVQFPSYTYTYTDWTRIGYTFAGTTTYKGNPIPLYRDTYGNQVKLTIDGWILTVQYPAKNLPNSAKLQHVIDWNTAQIGWSKQIGPVSLGTFVPNSGHPAGSYKLLSVDSQHEATYYGRFARVNLKLE